MTRKLFLLFCLSSALILTGASCVSFKSSNTQGNLGVYRSSDQGESWQAVISMPTSEGVKSLAGANIYRLHQDPSDPNSLYMATRGQGLYYSYDNANSWQAVAKFKDQYVYGLAVDPKNKCTVYVTNGSNIYRSTDCNRNWDLIYTESRVGERFIGLAVDFSNSNIVYGAEYDGDVLMSGDGGNSWTVIKRFGFQLRDIIADNLTPGRIYIASYKNGLARSDDQGQTWQTYYNNLKQFSGALNFNRLVLHPNQKDSLFWVSKYGILRSDDAGATWQALKLLTPPGSVNIYGFAVSTASDKVMYYTGTILGEKNENVRSTFYKTVDGGNSWVTKKLPTNSIPAYMITHPENSNLIFLGFANLSN